MTDKEERKFIRERKQANMVFAILLAKKAFDPNKSLVSNEIQALIMDAFRHCEAVDAASNRFFEEIDREE
jgi:hypothetical protein